jgi:hypothetical protein
VRTQLDYLVAVDAEPAEFPPRRRTDGMPRVRSKPGAASFTDTPGTRKRHVFDGR